MYVFIRFPPINTVKIYVSILFSQQKKHSKMSAFLYIIQELDFRNQFRNNSIQVAY